jgi:soluble cytochrome b562
MRTLTLCILIVASAVTVGFARDESLDALKSRVETAPPQDRPPLCVQIAEIQLHNADKLYTEGNVEKARAAVADIVTYSEKARDSAKATGKHLKRVEIVLRKIAEKLTDIKRTLAFDDQPPVAAAIQRLQDLRTDLLQEMFKKEKK